jgi:hypothetical protein
MSWTKCYGAVLPYVFAIDTPDGSGSGVFFAYNNAKTLTAVATAAHVVAHADSWKQPIKLRHYASGTEVFLPENERVIFLDANRDSATIVFMSGKFPLRQEVLFASPPDVFLSIGGEVAWVGFPGLAAPNLCFFSGCVSAWVSSSDSYLIDGVAINGVSGGPVFTKGDDDSPQLIGTVSSYISNRVQGQSLPGLLRAQDLTAQHQAVATLANLVEAKEQAETSKQGTPPTPPPVAGDPPAE